MCRTRLTLERREINAQPPIPRFALLLMPSASGITLFYVAGYFAEENKSGLIWMWPCSQLR